MLSYEGTGKTIEKAIEDALFNLKAPREDVDIKILDEGGLFKKARVLVSISDECKAKYEENKVKTIKKEEEVEEILDIKELLKDEEEKPAPKKEEPKKEECIIEECENEENEENEEEEKEVKTYKAEPTAPRVKIDDVNCVKFLKGLCEQANISAEIECFSEGEKVIVNVTGENTSELIGYRGDCLNALGYLLNVYEQRSGGKDARIILDIENYREKREETLINLANRMARKVAKTRHQVKLEPMTPNERRIIHTALQNDGYVTTFSKGTEPNRYLVIAPKNK